MLLNLNDDCLEYLFKSVDLFTQLALTKVCKRLREVVVSIWRRNCTLKLTKKQLTQFKYSRNDFFTFMSCIEDTLKELHLDRIERSHLEWIHSLRFSKLERLDCNIWHDSEETNDEDVLLIDQLFPAVTSLTLLSNITGQHIADMQRLVELDLSGCETLRTEHLSTIFSRLKLRKFTLVYYGYTTLLDSQLTNITDCRTLEELKIDDDLLLLFIEGMMQMPKMRKLECFTTSFDDDIVEALVHEHGNRIQKMFYDTVLLAKDRHIQHLIRMTNLKQLFLHSDVIEDAQLIEIARNLHELRELHLTSMALEGLVGLLEIAKRCKHLEVLNVSGTNVNVFFVKKLNDALRFTQRSAPLELYCFDTPAQMEGIKEKAFDLQQLIISVKKLKREELGAGFFLCEWLPSDEAQVP